MKIEIKPVAMLENYIATSFRLQKKGRKLLEVGFALFGAAIGVLILQLATLLACGLGLHLWWRSMLPWIPIFGWASWRFFFRYLNSRAFVCDHCGRLKCFKARSVDYFGKTKICRQCETRSSDFRKRIEDISRGLDAIKQGVEIVVKHPDDEFDQE